MRLGLLLKHVSYLVAGLGIYAITLGGELSQTAVVLAWLGYVASYFVEGPRIVTELWARAWTGLTLGFFALEVLRGFWGAPVLALGLEFAAFLQVSRLFNRRNARDYQQIGVLAFLHLTAATVLSTDLDYAGVYVAFAIAAPWLLSLSELRSEVELHYGHDDGQLKGAERVARLLASRRVVDARFLTGTALLSLPVFLLTVGLFMGFPRLGLGFLSFSRGRGQATAGFGSDVELGGFGTIRDDPTVVVRVTPPGGTGSAPTRMNLLLRGAAFDHYDGGRWTRSNRSRRARNFPSNRETFAIVRWPRPERDDRYHIVLSVLDEPVLLLPPGTVGVSVPPRVRSGIPIARAIEVNSAMEVRYGDADGTDLAYDAFADPRTATMADVLRRDEFESYTQLPRRSAAIDRLLDETVPASARPKGVFDPAATIAAVTRVLRDSGRYRYTLSQPATEGRDPLEVFLFEAKAGHCEYFSTALAVILRHAGIPARNVTGFLGGTYNPYGGYYAIRQGDAHSWVEANPYGVEWITIDPTPSTREAAGFVDGWFSGVRQLFDAIGVRWNQYVVQYDLRRQVELATAVLDMLRSERSAFTVDQEASDRTAAWRPPALLGGLAGVALVGAAALVWRARRRRNAGASGLDPRVAEAVGLYRELERRLRRSGHPKPVGRTPREHVVQLERAGHPAAPLAKTITDRYLDVRFGGGRLAPAESARLRALLRRL